VSACNGTILAVDDDPASLALLTSVLREAGYHVQTADSGHLGLISAAAAPPELILLNIRMDGFEVCRRIKETDHSRRIPVLVVSESGEVHDWARGLALGASDFVSKPFQREELLARVRTHMELGNLRKGLETRLTQPVAELDPLGSAIKQTASESEDRFREIANAAPVIIWSSGPDNHIDFRSHYAQEFTGKTVDELIGEGWAEIVHPDDVERQRRTYAEAIRSRTRFQLEYRARQANGEYCWMLDLGIPRFLDNGQFAGYVGIVIDYTEVKRSQERAVAAPNLKSLRVLTAGIAHDFNSMIGAIFGEADLALSDLSPDSPAFSCIERIVSVAKRSAEIVKLLMAYAGDRSESAPMELINLNSLVKEIVPHLRGGARHSAEFRLSFAEDAPSVLANALQIRHAVLNVLVNAVEALEGKKGVVTVSTGGRRIEDGSAGQLPAGRYATLEVSDTGAGMTPEMLGRIFDPYYSTKFLGRGLGLAAVQGIVQSHRGAISARSSTGGGSTFEILLPCAASGADRTARIP
jgi:PAS domain S-box-containing protein